MRIVLAPQEFKGTLTAHEAAEAMAAGVRRAILDAEVDSIPVSDGGPGLMEALLTSLGGRTLHLTAQDPLGRPIEAGWALLADGTAVIESAAAAGLVLLTEAEKEPARTSTYGVGLMILAALDQKCTRIIVGLGGSATNDGGAGMASALGVQFLDIDGTQLPPGGAALARLDRIDASRLDRRLRNVEIVAASDVTNPLCGPEGASFIYGPQKGASRELALELDAALLRYASMVERDLSVRVVDASGAGAAGGLGAGLIAFANAQVLPGFDVVAETIGLLGRIQHADLVITGEGRLDGQTAYGKAVFGVARMAKQMGVPVLVVPGVLGDGWEAMLPYVDGIEPMVGAAATEPQARERPAQVLAVTVQRALGGWLRTREISEGG
jgi:glycerate kinase